jgi:hypothetical protein
VCYPSFRPPKAFDENPISSRCGPSQARPTSSLRFVYVAQLGFPVNPLTDLPHPAEGRATAASPLFKRDGYHRATVYTSPTCSGPAILDVENFGCGEVCRGLDHGYSMLLLQENRGNINPTAALYYTTNCTGPHASVGIWVNKLSGCTDIKNKSIRWMSVRLYFDC